MLPLKASAQLNDRAVMAGFAALRPGITETEVAEAINAVYRAAAAQAEFISVCFGANGAFPHHHTGTTRLANGMAVMIDAGARLNGYPSDMTRSWLVWPKRCRIHARCRGCGTGGAGRPYRRPSRRFRRIG